MEQLDDEIKHVASLIEEAAETTLPRCKVQKVSHFNFNDKTLSQLFAKVRYLGRHGRMEVDPMKVHYLRLNAPLARK